MRYLPRHVAIEMLGMEVSGVEDLTSSLTDKYGNGSWESVIQMMGGLLSQHWLGANHYRESYRNQILPLRANHP